MAQAVAIASTIATVASAVQAVRSTFGGKKDKSQPAEQPQKNAPAQNADAARRDAQERQRRAAAAQSERNQNILTSPQGVAAQTQLAGQKTVLGQ